MMSIRGIEKSSRGRWNCAPQFEKHFNTILAERSANVENHAPAAVAFSNQYILAASPRREEPSVRCRAAQVLLGVWRIIHQKGLAAINGHRFPEAGSNLPLAQGEGWNPVESLGRGHRTVGRGGPSSRGGQFTPLAPHDQAQQGRRAGIQSRTVTRPSSVARISVPGRYFRSRRRTRAAGASSHRPCSGVPSKAAKQAPESNRGRHSQSIDPSRPTRAAVWQSPINA